MNYLGLNENRSKQIADELNILLATLMSAYLVTWHSHWAVIGLVSLHIHKDLLDRSVDQYRISLDKVAERIQQLGYQSNAGPQAMITNSLSPFTTPKLLRDILTTDLHNIVSFVIKMREIANMATLNGQLDFATQNLLCDEIEIWEKYAWGYNNILTYDPSVLEMLENIN